MSTPPIGPIRKAWYRWKSLKLPWRKRFLVGLDLQGNTFWEFRDTLSSHKHRMRRIAQYPASTHYSDIKISPQWHQWLRHTRADPPSLSEQSHDIIRQRNLKVLAAEVDARWAAKPSLLDTPGQARSQTLPALKFKDSEGYGTISELENRVGTRTAIRSEAEDTAKKMDVSAKKGEDGVQHGEMQGSDGIRPHFNERPSQDKKKAEGKKAKDDPWKQARGGENWQPAAWDGNIAAVRR